MAAFWTLVGMPAAVAVAPRPLAAPLAPALGWAIHSALALPLFSAIGMTPPVVLATTGLFAAFAAAALWRQRVWHSLRRPSGLLIVAVLAAAVLALAPMAAILPKITADGVTLAPPIFDHAKIALIDEIIRAGVPANNPFFTEIGAPEHVAYYYLWHFSAAAMAIATGAGGWAADAALTWFTAFASLTVMVGLAVAISGRAIAGLVAVALAATASLRLIAGWLLGQEHAQSLIGEKTGLGGWLFQVSWAPQHVAAATCVVLAGWLMAQTADRKDAWPPLLLGLVVAAGFESSIWVGGITFALAAAAIAVALLRAPAPPGRRHFVVCAAAAAALTLAMVAPLLHEQLAVAALRGGGNPIAIAPVDVLGDAFPAAVRQFLDPPAYWLVYLPLEFPAFYLPGLAAVLALMRERSLVEAAWPTTRALMLLLAASLAAAWLLVSTVGDNNDLGWRAVLPAVMLLIVFAAAGISRRFAAGSYGLPALALVGCLTGLPEAAALMRENVLGNPNAAAKDFARSPRLWAAVRRHTARDERVANNPHDLAAMTLWPANISWALLADRRSCYAGNELALAFAPISAAQRADVDARFKRVFDGDPLPGDLDQLARRYRCDIAVLTPRDGAWTRDPFASGDAYRVVEDAPDWRIYRRIEAGKRDKPG